MPVIPSRPTCLLLLLVPFFFSCSGRSGGTAAVPSPPEVVASSPEEDSIRQARLELERGEALARHGDWREARLAFDRAVDLLLSLPGGVSSSPEARSLYDELLSTIHEVEREYLAQLEEAAEGAEQSETAAVDELTSDESLMEAVEELAEDIAGAPPSEVEVPAPATYDIPVVTNARVLAILEMFQTEKREWFQEALDRSVQYMPLFRRVLSEEGLPQDLVFLAMIESAFKPRAVSRAGARGIWQFISGTGKLYGLQQDYWVDDRFDPEKATRAAARHLRDLHEDFGDWYLAMSAYNAGPRRVERAVKRSGIRDFWTLSQKRLLPRETRSYVPLILAATIIGRNPQAYGFLKPMGEPLEYDVVELDHPVDLETAAKSAGTSVEDLKLLNPELRHWVTPLDRHSYALKVPRGTTAVFQEAIAAIPDEERVRFGAHVVQRGDTLSRIAQRYGTTVEALTSANRLNRRALIHPGQVLTVPVPPGALADKARFFASSRETIPEGHREIYVVRRGDTLGAIARSFRMSLDRLRALNDLPPGSSRIHPGQRLTVSGSGSPPPRRASAAPAGGTGDLYTVKPGDTLGGIAGAHGLPLSALRSMNGLSSRATRIYPGQKLVVRAVEAAADASGVNGTRTTSYRIRRGDTLSTIARRFGVSIDELRQWNGIDSDRIVTGQQLTIRVASSSQ